MYVLKRTLAAAVLTAVLSALFSAIISWHLYPQVVHKRAYKLYREIFGERTSFPFELDLTESGIRTNQLGVDKTVEWANVEEINESEDAVEFYMRNGDATFVRKRAFASPEEQLEFIKTAERYLNNSRTSSNWLQAG